MAATSPSALSGSEFMQVGWVVKDIRATEQFFLQTMGVSRFWKAENVRAQDIEGTYRGQPGDFVFHFYLAYVGEIQVELIQPVSGQSMYQDFLDQRGEGVQHVAYAVPSAAFDAYAAALTGQGHSLIQGHRTPGVRVGYFDTYTAMGIVTEILGLGEEARQLFEQLKRGEF